MPHRCLARLIVAWLALLLIAGCTGASVPSLAPSVAPDVRGIPRASSPSIAPSVTPDAGGSSRATPFASPCPVPLPSAVASLNLCWVEHPFAGGISAVVGDHDRFVAVGGADGAQAAWPSTDAVTWERHPVPLAALDDHDAQLSDIGPDFASRSAGMGHLVRLDETLYSIGSFNFMDFVRPVGWRWTDGEQWEPIASSSGFYAEGSVRDVTSGGGALVAARWGLALSLVGADSTVWAWRPETSWVRGDLSAADAEKVLVTHVAWNGEVFVAIGFALTDDPSDPLGAVAVWSSADGLSWSRVESPPGATNLCAIEASSTGAFVALGVEADRSMAWSFRDASAWEGVALPDGPGDPGPGRDPFFDACELTPLGGQMLAVIGLGDGTQTWTSSDSSTWTSGVTLPSSSDILVAAMGETVIVVMREYASDGSPIQRPCSREQAILAATWARPRCGDVSFDLGDGPFFMEHLPETDQLFGMDVYWSRRGS